MKLRNLQVFRRKVGLCFLCVEVLLDQAQVVHGFCHPWGVKVKLDQAQVSGVLQGLDVIVDFGRLGPSFINDAQRLNNRVSHSLSCIIIINAIRRLRDPQL